MDICIATNNRHKVDEIVPFLEPFRLRVPSDLGFDFGYEETASTFHENALGKAWALHALVGGMVLADDSGLCVDALDGKPGVWSARYGSKPGGPLLGAAEKNRLLLAELEGVKSRSCRFVCCMAIVLGNSRFFVVQETCEGSVLEAPRGEGGFGYDPVVFLHELGKSVAELTAMEKNRVSHRGKALARVAALLRANAT